MEMDKSDKIFCISLTIASFLFMYKYLFSVGTERIVYQLWVFLCVFCFVINVVFSYLEKILEKIKEERGI